MYKLNVLLLTKNEEKTILKHIQDWQKLLGYSSELSYKIAIVDDSNDNTRKIASQHDITIIDGGQKGLGHAYKKGLEWLQNNPCDFVVTMDADGQVNIDEFKFFWKTLHTKNVDMILSSRFKTKGNIKYKYPISNHFGVYLLAKYLTWTSGQKFTDSHGGLRLFRYSVAKKMEVNARHSYVQVSSLSALRAGFKVIELPSEWKKRNHGHSRVVHSKFKYFKNMFLPLTKEGLKTFKHRFKYAIFH